MGLLDFMNTPEGQGLLSAAFGGMASARRGAPINSIGRAGLAGLQGYSGAIDQQNQRTEQEAQTKYRNMQISQAEQAAKTAEAQRAAQQIALSSMSPEIQKAVSAGVPFSEIWKRQNPEDMYKVVGGSMVKVSGDNVQPVYTAPEKLPEWATTDANGNRIVDPAYLSMRERIAAAGRSNSTTNVFNNTKDDFKNERDLRNDFSGLPSTKAFAEVQSAYDQIQAALANPSPASDMAAATKIMKILDPGSVVRESELGMAMSATGAMDRITNYADMVIKGTKLTPSQREDFSNLSNKLYEAAASRYSSSVDEYQGIAKDYNLNPDRIAKKPTIQPKPANSKVQGSKQFDIDGEKVIGVLGGDGNYYVTRNGKKYRVEE